VIGAGGADGPTGACTMDISFRNAAILITAGVTTACAASTTSAVSGATLSSNAGIVAATRGSAGVSAFVGLGPTRGKCDGNLELTPGRWTDITPSGLDLKSKSRHSYGANDVQIDPLNPCLLYAAFDMRGLYKSTSSGSSWTQIGTLDSPLHLRIDPRDSKHLYAVQGVRGGTQGFWISKDGGDTWALPAAFADLAKSTATFDAYCVDVDPADFDHVLVTFHGPWVTSSDGSSGILESRDGGLSWDAFIQPDWGHGNCAWFIDSKTWLFGTQARGYFRTTDAGKTWTVVHAVGMTLGGVQLYRSPTGAYYAGAMQYPIRSADNGATWEQLKVGLPYSHYGGIVGDGEHLYTTTACACDGAPFDNPYFTAPEKDAAPFIPYRGGTQRFANGPNNMAFDKANDIIYSANWDEGVWALKIERGAKGP
jgi:hypothetical protein